MTNLPLVHIKSAYTGWSLKMVMMQGTLGWDQYHWWSILLLSRDRGLSMSANGFHGYEGDCIYFFWYNIFKFSGMLLQHKEWYNGCDAMSFGKGVNMVCPCSRISRVATKLMMWSSLFVFYVFESVCKIDITCLCLHYMFLRVLLLNVIYVCLTLVCFMDIACEFISDCVNYYSV
jgi:Protein of unknown function (DUF295)